MHMHMYTYTCICICIYMYMYMYTYICMHIYRRKRVHRAHRDRPNARYKRVSFDTRIGLFCHSQVTI